MTQAISGFGKRILGSGKGQDFKNIFNITLSCVVPDIVEEQ